MLDEIMLRAGVEGRTARVFFRKEGQFDLGFEGRRRVLCDDGKGVQGHSVNNGMAGSAIPVPSGPQTLLSAYCVPQLCSSSQPHRHVLLLPPVGEGTEPQAGKSKVGQRRVEAGFKPKQHQSHILPGTPRAAGEGEPVPGLACSQPLF